MNDLWRNWAHRTDVTLAIGLVLALFVTVHALLNKREVASAVGWIGLVWFAPVMGAIGYFMFGVNRVKRRAKQLRPHDGPSVTASERASPTLDGNLPQLDRSIGLITGRPLLPSTAVQVYRDGDEAYPAMLAAIAAAKSSVGMSSYIFRDDIWGRRFIAVLVEAQRRGVAVRVLIDGIGGGWLLSSAYHRLRREGVPAARFMHSLLPWRMAFINLRTHKKILVVDGVVGFTGGMNIADENVMATDPKAPVRDMHFRIEGAVVSQLVDAFMADWAFATNEDLPDDAWLPTGASPDGAPARVIDSGPDADIEKVEFAVLQAIACARDSIAVMTPYFLPDERLISALAVAAMRGVAVDVVVPEHSNHPVVDCATRANVGPLLANGVRVWRSPPPFHHSKLMVVDDEWCLIGSSNWDLRSFRLNFELCLEIYDRTLATALTAVMRDSRGRALTAAELDRRRLPARLRDAAARLMLPYV
jgi:cardiolipin synthase